MIFLQMILQMFAFILIELSFLNEMMVLRTIGPFLFPTRNIQLIFPLIIRPNLKVPIQTTLPTQFQLIRHFELLLNSYIMISVDQPHYEIFYLAYDQQFDARMQSTLKRIVETYATFKCIPHSQALQKNINEHYHQIKLTKRKVVFAVLLPADNPELPPVGSKMLRVTAHPTQVDHIKHNLENYSEGDLEVELIKKFQLDSIWVGLLYRIGTDVELLEEYLCKEESFMFFQISYLKRFYEKLESKLQKSQFSIPLLKNIREELENSGINEHLNSKVEQLIRSRFNSRMIISDISSHPHLHLLSSRNYFNLIYIEGQIFKRYQNFKDKTLSIYPRLKSILSFESFVQLDDYIYSEFIFNALGKVKKYINRTLSDQPYSTVVAKHHKDIIREFRPSYNQYFLCICMVLKERAACLKEAVGSIIVKNNKIISTGYNGTPVGTINCYNGGCQVCNNSQKISTVVLSCRCIHAEYNCILKAGITATPGAVLYSTSLPCLWCSKLIIQGRISQVICLRSKYSSLEYENAQLVKKTLMAGKVEVLQLELDQN